jgi:NAD(P)-dependent dehydrogenase (short-subunit alcohol dehydrogenase family)
VIDFFTAGVLHLGPIEFIPDDQWDNTIAVMLTAPFQLTKRCLPAMKKKGNILLKPQTIKKLLPAQ